jgi:hypothetical protein
MSGSYISQRSIANQLSHPTWAAVPERMGSLTRYPHSEPQTVQGRNIREGFCSSANGVNKCIGEPIETTVENTSNTISGCPTCGSLKMSLVDRTPFDRSMFQFYNTKVMPRLDTNLIDLYFTK